MTRRTLALLLTLVGASLVGAEAAVADPASGRFVSGEYAVVDLGATTCEPLDDVRLRCETIGLRSVYGGDLVGESTADLEQVINCATGRTYGHGTETFAGSSEGGTGTVTWRLSFTAAFDCATFFPSNLRIVGAVVNGTGALAGLRGALRFDDATYQGMLG